MARFAARAERVRSFGDQPGMVGGGEVAIDFVVALFAFFGTDVLGSGDIWEQYDRAINAAAGDGNHHEDHYATGHDQRPEPAHRQPLKDWKMKFHCRVLG